MTHPRRSTPASLGSFFVHDRVSADRDHGGDVVHGPPFPRPDQGSPSVHRPLQEIPRGHVQSFPHWLRDYGQVTLGDLRFGYHFELPIELEIYSDSDILCRESAAGSSRVERDRPDLTPEATSAV